MFIIRAIIKKKTILSPVKILSRWGMNTSKRIFKKEIYSYIVVLVIHIRQNILDLNKGCYLMYVCQEVLPSFID